jgi:hypothetical protein
LPNRQYDRQARRRSSAFAAAGQNDFHSTDQESVGPSLNLSDGSLTFLKCRSSKTMETVNDGSSHSGLFTAIISDVAVSEVLLVSPTFLSKTTVRQHRLIG